MMANLIYQVQSARERGIEASTSERRLEDGWADVGTFCFQSSQIVEEGNRSGWLVGSVVVNKCGRGCLKGVLFVLQGTSCG